MNLPDKVAYTGRGEQITYLLNYRQSRATSTEAINEHQFSVQYLWLLVTHGMFQRTVWSSVWTLNWVNSDTCDKKFSHVWMRQA